MSDTHNNLQRGNNYKHWKILDLVLDLNYYFFLTLIKPYPDTFTSTLSPVP